MDNSLVLWDVSYKNQPKVYGINDDWTDEKHTLEDLLNHITGVDGFDLEVYKAKVIELATMPVGGYIGRTGNIGGLSGLLTDAYCELKSK